MANKDIVTPLYNSIDELLKTAKKADHHRISEFNVNNRKLDKKSKGSIGQIIEVKYKEQTKNKNGTESLQFPVFVEVRNDKVEVSYE